jgi:hypothetical protein
VKTAEWRGGQTRRGRFKDRRRSSRLKKREAYHGMAAPSQDTAAWSTTKNATIQQQLCVQECQIRWFEGLIVTGPLADITSNDIVPKRKLQKQIANKRRIRRFMAIALR